MVGRIEFLGIPGSGKTTLARAIRSKLKNKENVEHFSTCYKKSLMIELQRQNNFKVMISFILNKLLRQPYTTSTIYNEVLMHFMVENNVAFQSIYDLIIRSADKKRQERILKLLFENIYQWELIKRNSSTTRYVLMDESFAQRILTIEPNISMDEKNKSLIDEFLMGVGYPDIVISLQCDINDSIDRMNKRTRGVPKGFRRFNKFELANELNKLQEYTTDLCRLLESHGTKVIYLENSDLLYSTEKAITALNESIEIK